MNIRGIPGERVGHATERERMKPWSEIPEGRERDAAVATSIFGLRRCNEDYDLEYSGQHVRCRPWRDANGKQVFGGDSFLPHYTTDASADYSVLEFVRKEWDAIEQDNFCCNLSFQLESGSHPHRQNELALRWALLNYTPGMFSAAAYESVRLSRASQ